MPTSPPRPRSAWLLPAGLLLLLAVPGIAGLVRLASLASHPVVTPENARFVENPLPAAVHILAILVYGILGAYQVSPAFRKRHLAWHKAAGRWAIPAGFIAAGSGLWLTWAYPAAAGDGPSLGAIRWVVGLCMLAFLGLGLRALLRRAFADHGAWMLRAYALGMGAGTQVFTHAAWYLAAGKPMGWARDGLMLAGWLVNALLAESILARQRRFGITRAVKSAEVPNPAHAIPGVEPGVG